MKPKPSSRPEDAEIDAIVQMAAVWRARQDAGLTTGEQAELTRWLEADPRHRDLFAEMDSTWEILERAREVPTEELGWQPRSLVAATSRRGWARARFWGAGLAAAAAVILVALGWTTLHVPSETKDFCRMVEAVAGAIKRMDLPDGSVIRLNAVTQVIVDYTEATRSVRLVRGEAHFEVAKNPVRPFIVHARDTTVRAVGTAFNIALKGATTEVLVTEGKVTVAPPLTEAKGSAVAMPVATPSLVQAGEKLVLEPTRNSAPVLATVSPADVAQTLAWQDRRLNFDSVPLADILAEFNRFNVHQLAIAPDSTALGRQRFGGSFRADDPLTFVELLKTRANVRVESGPQQTVLRLAR